MVVAIARDWGIPVEWVEFQFYEVKELWRWMVVLVVQHDCI